MSVGPQGPSGSATAVDLSAVIVAVRDEVPQLLTVDAPPHAQGSPEEPAGDGPALPSGPLDTERDLTLERGLRRWVDEQTGLPLGYVEQLYTFGDRWRDPEAATGDVRRLAIAYLALVSADTAQPVAGVWQPWYELLPWEDHRQGRPGVLREVVDPALQAWAGAPDAPPAREERVALAFGLGGVAWDVERTLERYELLYEAGLVAEAERDRRRSGTPPGARGRASPRCGPSLALDHRRIAATALGRLRGKLAYRPVVFELLPDEFTLLQLQRLVEALTGLHLHKQNFRRLLKRGRLVEGTGREVSSARGRPAELYRFRREVLRERPAPGVGVPSR